MKRFLMVFCVIAVLFAGSTSASQAQNVKWIVGGNMLLSMISGGGLGTNAGFHFGPMAEVVFSKQYAIGTEFNINTQAGTPVEWADYFKYYISVPGSKVRPYVDGGFGLLFVTGGPYFGIRFGGGALFNIAPKMYIGPDLQLGPVFVTGSTLFYILLRGGFRYEV
jgi:hypothetical protein